MKRFQLMGTIPVLALAVLAVAFGCAKKSPLEQMMENRSRYTAELNESGFILEETPLVAEVAGGDSELEAEPQATSAGEDEGEGEMLEPEPIPVEQKVHLDILLRHDSYEKLPGVTVDISMVDTGLNEKGHWRVWLDTSNIERANLTQFSHTLENIDYVEGDAFSVEVRHPIPEAERGDYKEFADFG